MPPPDLPDPNAIPEARVVPHKRWSLRLVWLVPLAAALIGVGLGIKALRERGPTVRIAFASAEGIEAQKTRVKFRNMDIGRVTEVNLSEDRQRVVATVEMSRQAQPLLVSDTRFWIVRPRISATQVSGLGTLFSGWDMWRRCRPCSPIPFEPITITRCPASASARLMRPASVPSKDWAWPIWFIPWWLIWQCIGQSPGISGTSSTSRVVPTGTSTVVSGHCPASGIGPPSVATTFRRRPWKWIG